MDNTKNTPPLASDNLTGSLSDTTGIEIIVRNRADIDPPQSIPLSDDTIPFDDVLVADDLTVASRKKGSAWASSFNAVMRRSGIPETCRKLKIDFAEVKSIYLAMIDAAQRSEYQAEGIDVPHSKKRRFKASAATMELYFKRSLPPSHLRGEEKEKWMANRGRNWRRRLMKIIKVQCGIHFEFFVYERGEASDRKKIASHYTDRLTDLLIDVSRRARNKGGEPISRYNRAADEALEAFKATFGEYAALAIQEQVAPDNDADEEKPAVEKDEWSKFKTKFLKLATDTNRLAKEQGLSRGEYLNRVTEIYQIIEAGLKADDQASANDAMSALVNHEVSTAISGGAVSGLPDDLDRAFVSYPNSSETPTKPHILPAVSAAFVAYSGSMKQAALEYASHGVPVFPLKRDKRPLTIHGHLDATVDAAQIEKWWATHPEAGVGIPTISEFTNLLVIDIDPRNGGDVAFAELIEKLGDLPDTFRVRTGGGGWHLYFLCPEGIDDFRKTIGYGVDIKAKGYVVAPPTVHESGKRYEPENPSTGIAALPSAWVKAVAKSVERQSARAEKPLFTHKVYHDGHPILEQNRNDGLTSVAGGIWSKIPHMDATELESHLQLINKNRCIPPLPADEVRSIAKSVSRYSH